MRLTPQKIYEMFNKNDLDKESSIQLLISIIENSDNDQLRLESITILNKISLKSKNIFKTIENLIISDKNPYLRNSALLYLYGNYKEKVLILIKWLLNNETSFLCLVTIVKILAKFQNDESKTLLINELKKIRFIKYLNHERNYKNKKYKKLIKKLLKSSILETLDHQKLAEIILNFLVVKNLTEKYPNVFFEINPRTLLVEELDLSDYFEYEVKGTPWGWKNNISTISELKGLNFLKNLKKLDLSNNLIKNVEELSKNTSLTHLILSNNQIESINNLSIFRLLKNLKYLDLRGNKIVSKLKSSDFKSTLKVVLNDYLKDNFE